MNLDLVHDIQIAYRKTVDAMSRPGRIGNFKEQAAKVEIETGCLNSTVILALMLLDTEVTFKVISKREAEVTRLINQMTYAKAAETNKANFILILKDATPEDAVKAIRAAYPGNLVDPQQSATLIFEVEELSNGRELILTGPGIESDYSVKIATAHSWVELRAEKNAEYPLGIDFIFTDYEGRLLCLPRTTQIRKQEIM